MTRINSITSETHYMSSQYAGYYQFVEFPEIIANFMVAYVGEDKLISKVSSVDVDFHAKRAIQEFSYDIYKSQNALEITVSPSLKEILPQDYVNYTKVAWVDNAGIEHNIYPTGKTSNPQFKGNLTGSFDEGILNVEPSDWTLGEDAGGDAFTWTNDWGYGGGIVGGDVNNSGGIRTTIGIGTTIKIPVPDIEMGGTYDLRWRTEKLTSNSSAQGKFTIRLFNEKGQRWTLGYSQINGLPPSEYTVGAGEESKAIRLWPRSEAYEELTTTHAQYNEEKCIIIEVITEEWIGVMESFFVTRRTDDRVNETEQNVNYIGGPNDSTTWSNYKSTTPAENNNDDYEDDTYWPRDGQRYGLDPQHAQANGSYYIDPHTHFIHFSSNLSGKTVILKYISDSMYSSHQMIVHKFAEEAIYKWIMYAILSTRANVPARQLMMLKKERRAAMRNAKLRLSNIKLEEITQVLRGKSKQIKH